jgi:hypothetical protein
VGGKGYSRGVPPDEGGKLNLGEVLDPRMDGDWYAWVGVGVRPGGMWLELADGVARGPFSNILRLRPSGMLPGDPSTLSMEGCW